MLLIILRDFFFPSQKGPSESWLFIPFLPFNSDPLFSHHLFSAYNSGLFSGVRMSRFLLSRTPFCVVPKAYFLWENIPLTLMCLRACFLHLPTFFSLNNIVLLLRLVRHFEILFSKTWNNILFAVIPLPNFSRASPGPVHCTDWGRSPTFSFKIDWNYILT